MKHGGGSVMVSSGVCSNGTLPLVKIQGIMDMKEYHSILSSHAVPGGLKLLGKGFTFMQDNDPKQYRINKQKLFKKKSSSR